MATTARVKVLGFGFALLFLLCSKVAAQGYPVIDVANVMQTVQAVAQLKQQLQSQLALYQSLTGVRGMATLLANPALANYLPVDWNAIYAQVRAQGYQGLSPAAQLFRQQTAIFDCQVKSGASLALCNHELNKNAQDAAFVAAAYGRAQQRVEQLDSLRLQIDLASDSKAIADLGARLTSETAAISNELAKLQLYKAMSDTEERLIAQQKHELGMQRLELTGVGTQYLGPTSRQ